MTQLQAPDQPTTGRHLSDLDEEAEAPKELYALALIAQDVRARLAALVEKARALFKAGGGR